MSGTNQDDDDNDQGPEITFADLETEEGEAQPQAFTEARDNDADDGGARKPVEIFTRTARGLPPGLLAYQQQQRNLREQRAREEREAQERTAADVRRVTRSAASDPNGRAAAPREQYAYDAGEDPREGTREQTRVRRYRGDDQIGLGHLPRHRLKPGWSYEFKAVRVLNEPVDPSVIARVHQQGWQREKARDWPELVPPEWDRDYVEMDGQILYSRPMHLTQEAAQEDHDRAVQQRSAYTQGAASGRNLRNGAGIPNQKGVEVVHLGLDIQEEVGSAR
jgi:hypothetical protein